MTPRGLCSWLLDKESVFFLIKSILSKYFGWYEKVSIIDKKVKKNNTYFLTMLVAMLFTKVVKNLFYCPNNLI